MNVKIIITTLLLICIGVFWGMWSWLNAPVSAVRNQCSVEDLVDDMDALNEAISKMGPYHNYIIDPKGNLFVNRGDGKWLKLRYRKGETK